MRIYEATFSLDLVMTQNPDWPRRVVNRPRVLPLRRLSSRVWDQTTIAVVWTQRRIISAIFGTLALILSCALGMLVRQSHDLGWLATDAGVSELSSIVSGITIPPLNLLDIVALRPAAIDVEFLVGLGPFAVGYALLVALFPFHRTKVIGRAALAAFVIGLLADRLSQPPTLAEIPGVRMIDTAIVAIDDGGLVTRLGYISAVLLLMHFSDGWLNRPIIARVQMGWKTVVDERGRPVGPSLFCPLGLARRLVAALLIFIVLLAVLWSAATVRIALVPSTEPYGQSGLQVQLAYVAVLALIALATCASEFRGRPGLYRAAILVVIARGLWPWPITQLELFESSPVAVGWLADLHAFWGPHAFWAVIGVYIPGALVLTGVAGRLMRWNSLPGLLPIRLPLLRERSPKPIADL